MNTRPRFGQATRTSAFVSVALATAVPGLAASFSNTGHISIGDQSPASPYPSTLTVSGLGSSLSSITVTLNNYLHSFSPDIAIVLQSPSGDNVMLMGNVGGFDVPSMTLTFDDLAASAVPSSDLSSGTYRPNDATGGSYLFSNAPGHSKPLSWTTTLATFEETNPNGTWKLFVEDFVGGDSGSISGGWTLNITAVPEPGAFAAMGGAALLGFALLRRVRG